MGAEALNKSIQEGAKSRIMSKMTGTSLCLHPDIQLHVDDPYDIEDIQKALPYLVLPNDQSLFKVLGYHSQDGYMIAAITDYNGTSCEVSGMAKGKWFHTSIYADLFGYIFKTLGCKRINFVVDTDNQKCIDLLEKGGCVRECKLRGIDRYLYSMIPEDFYGQEITQSVKTA